MPGLRFGLFVTALIALAAWETTAPRRRLTAGRSWRWIGNLGLLAVSAAFLIPLAAASLAPIAAARAAEWRGVGLLHWLPLPYAAKFIIAFLALDFAIYAQHWTTHAVPWLWRLHRVHHTDLDLDASSAVRFHPGELVLSLFYKIAVVWLLGAHFLAVAVFETVLQLSALANHANVRLPRRWEPWLRLFWVTPDMHRIHHSVRKGETNSNFGNFIPWWDRLLGTYEPEPADGHLEMKLGLSEWRSWHEQSLPWLLKLPFRS